MKRLLIVDDEEINRLTLEAGFSDTYEVIHAENGKECLEILMFDDSISAVLLDLNMPVLNGFEVLKDMNDTGLIKKIPVFIITSSNVNSELLKAYELGAVDVVSKPYNIQFLRRRVSNTIELYAQRDNLEHKVEEKTSELIRQNNRLVEAMADIVEFRSNESGTHVKRVSGYTKILMEGLIAEYPEYKSLSDDIESISFAACLHDLGKIAIPDAILNKPGRLTPEEFKVIQTHTVYGYKQVMSLEDIMDPKLAKYSIDIVRHHHERYDGKGYPDHLAGENISIWSQAVGLADVYDALTNERCYKKAFSHEVACKMIMDGECGIFNPRVLKIFTESMEKFNKFHNEAVQKKILFVDDSETDRIIFKNMLADYYDVQLCSSAAEALTHLENKFSEYNAIVIDLVMPEMNGFELVEHLGPKFVVNNNIFMCSSDLNRESVSRAVNLGIRTFIKKPFEAYTILNKLRNIIGD